ncbi:hypothetical protein FRZ06_11305 [Anoxybacterium hadale]|uniref:Uncharacterized protein n=1 Tax=Anoxybacterium hadale TaxID=3408580 RepID=A0ACD1ABK4_9FIRM|nr:hypothetical protein FRZ06_11305 [Clostridiales bacterium]
MSNDMGRPKNYTTEEIKNVIDCYVTYTGGTVLLNASQIARYANSELGLANFKYYVVNRNSQVKKYLKDLNERITGTSDAKLSFSKSVFTQIDANKYLSMKKDDLKVALNNLNILLENMANMNTELIKENVKLKNRTQEKDTEIRRLNSEISNTYNECSKSISNSKEKTDCQKQKIQELVKKAKQQEDLLHILWDREAETILKQNGIFEDDGTGLNKNRIIDEVKNVAGIISSTNDNKISYELINRLKNI